MSQIDLAAHIKTRIARDALAIGADPVKDRFVYMRRDGDWYIEFGLDINPPEFVIEKLRKRGWEILE